CYTPATARGNLRKTIRTPCLRPPRPPWSRTTALPARDKATPRAPSPSCERSTTSTRCATSTASPGTGTPRAPPATCARARPRRRGASACMRKPWRPGCASRCTASSATCSPISASRRPSSRPNGWRILAGFLVLCHSAGVPPSLPVFRYFFLLSIVNRKHRGCYFFRSRDTSGLRFKGMPSCIKDWKNSFFFLSSPEPWPFPVEWGEPSKSSFMEPVLDSEGKKHAAKLLRSYAGAAVDIDTCLSDSNLAAVMAPVASTPPPPPSFTRITSDSKGN
uniref:Transposase (putative) gypsy type domain-containing protein n=1 Tax=Aegilops tauschii subsp. strangulata TaxID=200361 RepID=A0A453QWM1_AEGTS